MARPIYSAAFITREAVILVEVYLLDDQVTLSMTIVLMTHTLRLWGPSRLGRSEVDVRRTATKLFAVACYVSYTV
jgi:hypothetical protein